MWASKYGRYGYRKIKIFGTAARSTTTHPGRGRTKRQAKRNRLWLSNNSCIHLRLTLQNHAWSYDFVTDRATDRRLFRILAVLDECSWECLAIDVGRKLKPKNCRINYPSYLQKRSAQSPFSRMMDLSLLFKLHERGTKNRVHKHSTLD